VGMIANFAGIEPERSEPAGSAAFINAFADAISNNLLLAKGGGAESRASVQQSSGATKILLKLPRRLPQV
jgi:hypothetical protein